MVKKEICFPANNFLFYTTFVFILVIGVLVYTVYTISNENSSSNTTFVKFLESVKNKLTSVVNPEPSIYLQKSSDNEVYPEKKYVNSRDYQSNSQQIGFIFNDVGERYSLFEQVLDRKYYYHIIDDSNNKEGIKIPITTKNYNQIYDDESVSVPEISTLLFKVKIYDTIGNKYNPGLF